MGLSQFRSQKTLVGLARATGDAALVSAGGWGLGARAERGRARAKGDAALVGAYGAQMGWGGYKAAAKGRRQVMSVALLPSRPEDCPPQLHDEAPPPPTPADCHRL